MYYILLALVIAPLSFVIGSRFGSNVLRKKFLKMTNKERRQFLASSAPKDCAQCTTRNCNDCNYEG